MKKVLSLTLLLALIAIEGSSQTDRFWSANNQNRGAIVTDKAVARLSYPKEFKLFNLNVDALRIELFSIAGTGRINRSTIISLPNADGNFEQFAVVEASNFEPDLQAQFPEIRAFSGKGITDKHATLKLSISPRGIQTMVFRTETATEFIEPYSQDRTVYSVFKSQRDKGNLPWACTTEDKQMVANINPRIGAMDASGTSTGQLKTMRLVQSCNGEYANYFGATSSAQVGLVLAAFNATLTRANGCYEKDLALHLNLIANTTSVIYYSPSSDPYSTTLSQWNLQLQQTLTSVIGSANYDIGHMFGRSGGGGNAGCIGCVCVNPTSNNSLAKGSGITSPIDGIPEGDNFDIDYVVHEVGHQLGANHTFSMSSEGTGVNKEVGSGITIMGYAGITAQDVAPHSIDIFHQASIAQIQANLANKICPVSLTMTANTAPVLVAGTNYTIPISTPFALTGSATDQENDALTYCWEQNDNTTTTGTGSVASPGKLTGPNWLSFSPSVSPTRSFPKLSTILSGLMVTPPIAGGDAGANIEALSSVSRTLNFRLTVRDNSPYQAGVKIGQTAFTDAVVTVTSTSGPFAVTAPNTAVTWSAGGAATVTWSVNGTNTGSVNCAAVRILLSTDGGQTFPTVLAASTANDGSESITVPGTASTTCRVKVESIGNIFFDISNTNFSIGAAPACGSPTTLSASAITETTATISWTGVSGANSYDVDYKAASSGTWINAATATTGTSVNLGSLTANTAYDWRVRANCTAGSGSYAQAQFSTDGPVIACPGAYDVSTNGTTSGAAVVPFNTDIYGTINVRGDNDYYRFVITTGGTITLSLGTLPADYQLALLNSGGSTVQTSANAGTANETINATVTPGTYYARVYPKNNGALNASNCYTLRVQTGTASRSENVDIQYVNNKVSLSPNPAGYATKLSFIAEVAGNATISVISQTGSVVLSKTHLVFEGENSLKLDLGNLSNGVYSVRIQAGTVTKMARLVVSK
ncbi:MAG: zinc-dependent metalloprotease family protein [Bacteroidota bacterium]